LYFVKNKKEDGRIPTTMWLIGLVVGSGRKQNLGGKVVVVV
jgi:hypothetical protein